MLAVPKDIMSGIIGDTLGSQVTAGHIELLYPAESPH
jgi:hypothetical protein